MPLNILQQRHIYGANPQRITVKIKKKHFTAIYLCIHLLSCSETQQRAYCATLQAKFNGVLLPSATTVEHSIYHLKRSVYQTNWYALLKHLNILRAQPSSNVGRQSKIYGGDTLLTSLESLGGRCQLLKCVWVKPGSGCHADFRDFYQYVHFLCCKFQSKSLHFCTKKIANMDLFV